MKSAFAIRLVRSKDSFFASIDGCGSHIQNKDRSSRITCQKGTHLRLCITWHMQKLWKLANATYSHSTRGMQDIFNSNWKLRCRPGKTCLWDKVPNRVIVGLVDTDTFNGSFAKNPYNFKNYKITDISLSNLNGQRTIWGNRLNSTLQPVR